MRGMHQDDNKTAELYFFKRKLLGGIQISPLYPSVQVHCGARKTSLYRNTGQASIGIAKQNNCVNMKRAFITQTQLFLWQSYQRMCACACLWHETIDVHCNDRNSILAHISHVYVVRVNTQTYVKMSIDDMSSDVCVPLLHERPFAFGRFRDFDIETHI